MLSPSEIGKDIAKTMESKAKTPLVSTIFLAIMAGSAIGMGDIFWAHSTIGMAEKLSIGMANFIGGLTFSSGLMMVVFYGGHLFTSSVLSGVSFYDKKLSLTKTANYWALVWVCNFLGSVLMAYMYYYSGLPLKFDGYILTKFLNTGIEKVNTPFLELFIRGIFCNIFVCMAIWTAMATKSLSGKFWAIMWMIAAFVACSMEHCVANMFIITQALIAKFHYNASGILGVENLNLYGFLVKNLVPVTLGNIIGGLFFVGLVGFLANKEKQ